LLIIFINIQWHTHYKTLGILFNDINNIFNISRRAGCC
jgi:hypothetical protein